MASCAALGSLAEHSPSRRSSRSRRSRSLQRSDQENQSVAVGGPPLNKFGFKTRSLVCASPSAAGVPGDADGQAEDAGAAPVDLLALVEPLIASLDGATSVLKMKDVAKGMKFDFKAKITALSAINTQLKTTLSEQIEKARTLPNVLAPAQEDINRRLLSLADDEAALRSSIERLKTELGAARQRGEERGKRAHDLKGELSAAHAAQAELKEQHAAQSKRAVEAEEELAQREVQLSEARTEVSKLRTHAQLQEDAAATASARAVEIESRCTQQAEEASRLAEQERQASQKREGGLSLELQTASQRAQTLEVELVALKASHEQLSATHEAVGRDLASSGSTLTAKVAELERTQADLEVTRAQLAEKDSDLRDSIKSVAQMQADNNAQLAHERERVQRLEQELQASREGQQQLRSELQGCKLDIERTQGELEVARQRGIEVQASLARTESEREQHAATIAEQSATLQLRQSEYDRLIEQLAETRESLAGTRASLDTRVEQVDKVTEAKRVLELEFRSYKEHHGSTNQQQLEAITDLKLMVDRLSQQVESKQVELGAKEGNMAEQQMTIQMMHQKLMEAENARRALHNTVQELKGNIRVFCRVRPGAQEAAPALDIAADGTKLCLTHSKDSYNFGFDKVFDPSSAQASVFEEVDGLVQSALDGYKVCIFAYGQTGSGKTFTMQGTPDPESWGLIPRSLSKILSASRKMAADGWVWSLEASFLEVYNETLRDLLNNNDGHNSSLGIKHEEAWGTVVAGLSRELVTSMEQINMLMARAAKQRAVGSTDMNSQSSRSHSVFQLFLKGVNRDRGTELHGALHLVDLAGSERLDKSGATGTALRETQNINKSLSSLADVFAAKAARQSHVPFRNSKLTYLMEPCLSGQGKTLMVVNVGPELDNSHETLCSLRFASQVNQCDTGGKPKRALKAAAGTAPSGKTGRPQTAGPSVSGAAKRAK